MTFTRNNGMFLVCNHFRPLLVSLSSSVRSPPRLRPPILSSSRGLSRKEDRLVADPSARWTHLQSNGMLLETVYRAKLQLSLMPGHVSLVYRRMTALITLHIE